MGLMWLFLVRPLIQLGQAHALSPAAALTGKWQIEPLSGRPEGGATNYQSETMGPEILPIATVGIDGDDRL